MSSEFIQRLVLILLQCQYTIFMFLSHIIPILMHSCVGYWQKQLHHLPAVCKKYRNQNPSQQTFWICISVSSCHIPVRTTWSTFKCIKSVTVPIDSKPKAFRILYTFFAFASYRKIVIGLYLNSVILYILFMDANLFRKSVCTLSPVRFRM